MKIVLDSNVCLAAFVSRGLCSALMELCLDRFEVISSDFILNEIKHTLTDKIRINPGIVEDIILYLRDNFSICTYNKLDRRICRDRDDDEILALAKSNECEFIITGDKDLLILKEFAHIRIFDPRQFWEYVRQQVK
jgi:putative PIN family toxin of toxin-antitoxin system